MPRDDGRASLPADQMAAAPASPFGLRGLFADPIAQAIALVLALSLVFSLFPGLDLWFSGLFVAEAGKGFPLQRIAAFDGFGRAGVMLVLLVLVATLAAIAWKLAQPGAYLAPSANAIAFVLASLAAVS